MENRIPLPTDNIYKFYALFGMLGFVFTMGALLYTNRTTNELLYSNLIQTSELRQIENRTRVQEARLAVLEKQREIALLDRKTYQWSLGGVLFVSFWAMWHGFRKWQLEIQPMLDETAKTNLEIAKLQLEKLRRELASKPAASPQETATEHPVI